jgi:UDP-N-acetylglucosamine:LPS N-acetylglucosamine transferase
VLLDESDLTVDRLVAEVDRLMADAGALDAMAARAAAAGERHRGGALVALIERVARA